MFERWNLIIADFLINIAAGWFGAIFISPNFTKAKRFARLAILIVDLLLAIFSLWVAHELRKL